MNTAVTGVPCTLLRLEGLAALVAALVGYHLTGGSWWLFALLFLLPDLALAGYAFSSRVGAIAYNAAHTYVAPCVLAGLSSLDVVSDAWPVCLVWVAHIGLDRALGLGLKFASGFRYTHLGAIGSVASAGRA